MAIKLVSKNVTLGSGFTGVGLRSLSRVASQLVKVVKFMRQAEAKVLQLLNSMAPFPPEAKDKLTKVLLKPSPQDVVVMSDQLDNTRSGR